MKLNKSRDIYFFSFQTLSRYDGLVHGIFLKKTASGNLLDYTTPVSKSQINKALGFRFVAEARQIHGTGVAVFPDDFIDHSGNFRIPEADAIVTTSSGVLLMIKTADCIPVLLHEPQRSLVAAIHCGWRGLAAGIIEKTISIITRTFDADPSCLAAGIGPSLGPCCAEFINFKKEFPEELHGYRRKSYRFDLWQAVSDKMNALGIPEKNIENSFICTRCNTHLLYSYRAGHATPRFASVIGLKR